MANVTGALIAKSLVLVAKKVEQNKDYLCELDGEVGDGDHGVSMTIGMRAVSRAAKDLLQERHSEGRAGACKTEEALRQTRGYKEARQRSGD
jgi:dihydroxyacetone kinase